MTKRIWPWFGLIFAGSLCVFAFEGDLIRGAAVFIANVLTDIGFAELVIIWNKRRGEI